MNDNLKIIKDILQDENRYQIIRDRFFAIYYKDIKPVSALSKEIGVSTIVISNIIKGKKNYHTIKTVVTLLNWILKKEEEFNLSPL